MLLLHAGSQLGSSSLYGVDLASISAEPAPPAEIVDAEVDGAVGLKWQVGEDLAQPHSRFVFGRNEEAVPSKLAEASIDGQRDTQAHIIPVGDGGVP